MTPEQFERFQTELAAFQHTPGYDLEQRMDAVEVIRYTYAENAVELEGALIAFQQPQMQSLMLQIHRDKLDQFLLLVTRRLYNHLATAVSTGEHLRRLFEKMPATLSTCRDELLKQLDDFQAQQHYRLSLRLRDHSIHHRLHVTSAQMTFGADQTPATAIQLQLGDLRVSGPTRRRKKATRQHVDDPIATMPDSVLLLPLVKESQTGTEGFTAVLKAMLVEEYKKHEADVEKAREPLRQLHDGNDPPALGHAPSP